METSEWTIAHKCVFPGVAAGECLWVSFDDPSAEPGPQALSRSMKPMWRAALKHMNARSLEQAMECFREIAATSSDAEKRANCYLGLGACLEAEECWESAIFYYELALNLKPRREILLYFIHSNLGSCLQKIGQNDKAEGHCRVAIDTSQLGAAMFHGAYETLGLCLKARGRWREAADAFVKATRLGWGPTAFEKLAALLHEHPELLPDFENAFYATPCAASFGLAQYLVQHSESVANLEKVLDRCKDVLTSGPNRGKGP